MLALQGSRTEQGIAARMASMGRPWPPRQEQKPNVPEPNRQDVPPINYHGDIQTCSSRGAARHKKRLRELCDEHGVTVAQICGSRGDKRICEARHQIIRSLASEFPAKSLSLNQIAALLGSKHHTSIINSLIITGCPERGYMEKGKCRRYSESNSRGA